MNIGIRLHDVGGETFEERMDKAKEQGFGCAHLALAPNFTGYSMTLPELTTGWAMNIKRKFDSLDMDPAVLGCYLNLATPDEAALNRTREIYKAHLRFASVMGAGVVGTETGAPNTDYHFEERCHSEEALDIFCRGLEPVVRYAESVGQILALEPVYRHIMYSPKQTRKVLDKISSPNLMVIFDPVNLLHETNYDNREEIFDEAMDLLANEITVLHIKDFVIEDGRLISCGAGCGMMDYGKILKFAKEKKPCIHATLEDTKPENAVSCREYILREFAKA